MRYCKITTMLPMERLEQVEEALKELDPPGLSVSRIKGYGAYKDFSQPDWCATHSRLDVFVPAAREDETVEAILHVAHTGSEDDGFIAVIPVERIVDIRTRQPVPEG